MRWYQKLLPGIIAALLAGSAFSLGIFLDPENFFEDLLFSPRPIHEDIVLVAIDNDSLSKVGQWPWKREVFANFFDSLRSSPPQAVGIDVLFGEPSRFGKKDDEALAESLRQVIFPVVMPMEADPLLFQRGGEPRAAKTVASRQEFLGENVRLAYVNLIPDRDGVVRRTPLGVRHETGSLLPAFALAVVGSEPKAVAERIAFAGTPGSVHSIPFYKVLENEVDRKELEGKYVFVGSTVPDFHDEKLTSFSRGVPMSGVEIHAQIANMALLGFRLQDMDKILVWLWIFFSALIPTFIFIFVKSTPRALGASIISGLVHLPVAVLFFEAGTVPNILHVNLAWILGTAGAFMFRHFVLEREKREIRRLFSKYVSSDVMEELLKNPAQVRLGGEERIATVFFSDVRGFTTLSEKLTPTELTHFLNRYFTVMTNLVLDHKGVVDKYIGDAIMAFWGAPVKSQSHALDSVRASLEMVDALHAFNEESLKAGGLSIDIGIGLNSGEVVAGNMGSDKRFDYTVMGDTVNLASRLEGQTKNYGVHIVTSEFSMAFLPQADLEKEGIIVREIDQVRVKGKTKPVRIFEIVERSKANFVSSIKSEFESLIAAYYAGKWKEAVSIGKNISSKGEDGPTKVLLERALHFLEDPPKAWEGVYDLKSK